MIKIILFLIVILLICLSFLNKKYQNKELFSNSCIEIGKTIGKNLGGAHIASCKKKTDCKEKKDKCPDNMERINNGPCTIKCSDKEYRDRINGNCKLKPCSVKGKQRDSEGNCLWPPCTDKRHERNQINGKCDWKPCDNEFRKRDEKTGKCRNIACPGPNSSEQIRNDNGDCEYKSCLYPDKQERINGICSWKQCDDSRQKRDNLGNCIYKECEDPNQERNAEGDCKWKPCSNNKQERNINGDCIWTPCEKLGMIQDESDGNCSLPKCPNSNQKRINGNCVDIIDCKLGDTIYSDCKQNNTRTSGLLVIIDPQNGGQKCRGKVSTIKGKTVYNFKEEVECGSCGSNQKRANGICVDVVDCELSETIYSDCMENNTRNSGQPIKILPQNGGKECEKQGIINGEIVYNFQTGINCDSCGNNQKRINGTCEDVIDCELGEIVFSNCDTDNRRNKGQLVKRNSKNGGIQCEKPGRINGQSVYNFQQDILCAPCEANQKRIQGNCREIINCKLGQTINSDCKETNTRFTGQLARITPENGGTECPTPTGEIKGQTVYNFQEVGCAPCGAGEVRKRGVCSPKDDWKLFYKSVSGNVQKNESRDNSKNSAIIAVIDSKMLKDVSNGNKERMDIWALGGGHGQPGLRYESRGYFMPKCKTDSRNIIAVFRSGTGNGLQYTDFRREDRWGDNDIIYIHSGYNGVSHIMTADKNGRIHYNRRNITSNDCPKQFNMTSNPNLTKFIKQFYIFQTNDKNKVFTYNDIPNSAKV